MARRDPLLVLDRLEVGPPRLRPDRLDVPYRVVSGDSTETTELTYKWDEPVFAPDSPASQNLAAMVGAQVALNYGLFCREIRFHGSLDAADRRFLVAMAENTSREIYVNKIRPDNPFLLPEVREQEARPRDVYTTAELVFPDSQGGEPDGTVDPFAPPGQPDRWAILSSGGKDSLLTFGLLRELGAETHPVFVAESGRHWLTALNAHRHFAAHVPHTARVWTNSDRVFNWMLRHLPFVRPDFGRVRSDEYPIRLWTVAVFLFGVLPLALRRGCGRIAIGDEHDTTVRARHHGIPHYAGLFDQSRFFDHALTRYYLSKGWGTTQLSLLRPLSELLIQQMLAERYPDLLALQVSCHAAHTEGEVVRPCGKCEKCRRIVGMLLASGHDPAACGYDAEQVAACRIALEEQGVHQEKDGAEHLAALLHEQGSIGRPRLGEMRAKRRPSVEKLRFHPVRSPADEVPLPLRRRLYSLYLEHANGAVRRVGRQWLPVDMEGDPALSAPYPFDRPAGAGARSAAANEETAETVLWGELTWPQAEERLRHVDVALLPVGAIEQHGPHLPLDTDSFDADYLCRRVAEQCAAPRPLVLPLLPYGVSYHHDEFAGTISVTNETLARLVYEVGMATARNGITKLVIVNGHGGNAATLHFAAQMINRDARIFTCVDSGETSDVDIDRLASTHNDVHAGEIETSTSLAARPGLVDMSRARPAELRFSSPFLDFTGERAVHWFARTARISPDGVFGDPTRATAEKGRQMWEVMIERLVELVEHLKGLSLEEIVRPERREDHRPAEAGPAPAARPPEEPEEGG